MYSRDFVTKEVIRINSYVENNELYELVIDGGKYCYFSTQRHLSSKDIETIDMFCKTINKTNYDIDIIFNELQKVVEKELGIIIKKAKLKHIFRVRKIRI